MKIFKIFLLTVMMVIALKEAVLAADVGTQVMTFTFQPINEIMVSEEPSLAISSSAIVGQEPSPVTDSSAIYAISTNATNKKITAHLDTALPSYLTLTVNAAAPSDSGTSLGDVNLSTSTSALVTGVGTEAVSSLTITYTLSATVQANVVATGIPVIFTLAD
ncbi:hypothetical protein [Desulfotalea psychrophila]|uniref:Uncharacterized protein n=1 Tax=Desulfotalea psychrophila (strain LSv54 / DSM 12343) TaxID=177439 RepID=Q6ALT5_DESPS|nr:hypothetical protein [Desulfotalea psychrophila]CAG36690.1 unknown protein [Desulfotalea psychrophila LSv54]